LANVITIDSPLPQFPPVFSGGDEIIQFLHDGTPYGKIALTNTNGSWDFVFGNNADIALNNAQVNIVGGGYYVGDYVTLDSHFINTGPFLPSTVELYGTGYDWDQVYCSSDVIAVNGAQANIFGGNNTISLVGDINNDIELYNNQGNQIIGNYGLIGLNYSQASVSGADNTVVFALGNINVFAPNFNDDIFLSNTDDGWDTIYGFSGGIGLTGAQANVIGGGNVVTLDSASTVELYSTTFNWDQVLSSGATVALNGAQANVTGGGNSIILNTAYNALPTGASQTLNSTLEIYGTDGQADSITADPGSVVALNSSQATVTGGSLTIDMLGAGNSLNLASSGEFISFAPGFGTAAIAGFADSDSIAFSASDFANWQALQAHMTQSGSDVLISSAVSSSTITLQEVSLANLSSTQFHFA
jgi:hypothetical protein